MDTETELRLGKDRLNALKVARRAHDRQFTKAAKAGDMEAVEDLTAESNDFWRDYEDAADALLRVRP